MKSNQDDLGIALRRKEQNVMICKKIELVTLYVGLKKGYSTASNRREI